MQSLDRLKEFIYAQMSPEQYEKSKIIFDNDERLLLYICLAYNSSEILYNKGTMHLITNPNDLFISKVEISAFLEEYKSLVNSVLDKEVKDGTNTNN